MKAKKDKCHLRISGNVEGNIIEKSICGELLGLNIDYKLKLNEHLESIHKSRSKRKCLLQNIALQEF